MYRMSVEKDGNHVNRRVHRAILLLSFQNAQNGKKKQDTL